jgi:hypothetical protein
MVLECSDAGKLGMKVTQNDYKLESEYVKRLGGSTKTNASENKYHQRMTVAYSIKTTKSCESSVNENMRTRRPLFTSF